MAFTEATLGAQLAYPAKITAFCNTSSASYTDVYVENASTTSRKAGWTQVAQSNTAAQAAAAILAHLSA